MIHPQEQKSQSKNDMDFFSQNNICIMLFCKHRLECVIWSTVETQNIDLNSSVSFYIIHFYFLPLFWGAQKQHVPATVLFSLSVHSRTAEVLLQPEVARNSPQWVTVRIFFFLEEEPKHASLLINLFVSILLSFSLRHWVQLNTIQYNTIQ